MAVSLPISLPMIDESPYDDPLVLPDVWRLAMQTIQDAINGASSGGSDANAPWFYKTGRAITSPLPTLAPSPALGVYLPVGFQWFQDGMMITLEEAVLVTDLPQNFDGYAVLKATDDGLGGYDWEVLSTATDKSTFAGGAGIIGHVVTDSSGLTSIDAQIADADIVLDMPSLAALFGGAGDAGSVITMLSQLIYNADDTRNAITVLEEKIAAAGGSTSTATLPVVPDNDQITAELAITRQGVITLAPDEGERSRSANVQGTVEGVFGDGSDSHPDYEDYTNATKNDNGEFEV